MEHFKIDFFIKEYNKPFPSYNTLSKHECQKISNLISCKFYIDSESLIKYLYKKQAYIEDINVEHYIDLYKLLNDLNIEIPDSVYINWDNFENIDKLKFEDLNEHFHDIWYPVTDDIELFDDNLNWIIMIDHEGYVGIINI